MTGSAHAVAAPYWAGKLGRDTFTAYQASARGGRLGCRLDGRPRGPVGQMRDGDRGKLSALIVLPRRGRGTTRRVVQE